LRNSASRWFLF